MKRINIFIIISLTICCLLFAGMYSEKEKIEKYCLNRFEIWNERAVNIEPDKIHDIISSIEDIKGYELVLSSRSNISGKKAVLEGITSGAGRLEGWKLYKGCWPTVYHISNSSPVAVIDRDLSFELFRKSDGTGEKLKIGGTAYSVIGVVETDRGLFKRTRGKEKYHVWIPADSFIKYMGASEYAAGIIAISQNGMMNKMLAQTIIKAMKWPDDHIDLYDLHETGIIKTQKFKTVAFLLFFLIPAVLLCQSATKHIKALTNSIKSSLDEYYLKEALKINFKMLICFFIRIALYAAVLFALFKLASFDFYISPKLIPDDLIDIKKYRNIIEELHLQANRGKNYIPETYLEVKHLDYMLNIYLISFLLLFWHTYLRLFKSGLFHHSKGNKFVSN